MTDFVDDDLIRRQPRPDIRIAPAGAPGAQGHPAPVPRPVPPPATQQAYTTATPAPVPPPQAPPAPLTRPKDNVEDQVASAMKELERLRQRQESLESQKSDLEEMRRKQRQFEEGKREMLDRLSTSLITLEKEEIKLEQLSNLLSTTRSQYKARLGEIESTNEDNWSEDKYREELNKALALIEDTRSAYNKAQARIESLRGKEGAPVEEQGYATTPRSRPAGDRSFLEWVKVGFAVSLPFIFVYLLLSLLNFLYSAGMI